jgi:transposase-like protein
VGRKIGRPTECNAKTIKRITDAVRFGLSYERAARAAGIEYQTMRNWIQRAEAERARLETEPGTSVLQSEQPFLDFFEALSQAEADGEYQNARRVYQAAAGNWRAAAWILERRHSHTWGDNTDLWRAYHELRRELGLDSTNTADTSANQAADTEDA